MFLTRNTSIISLLLCIGYKLKVFSTREMSEYDFITRLGNERLIEIVREQKTTIEQKDRALKRLLAQFTGSSSLPKSWLNSEIVFNELLKDPKMLRAEVNVLLERQNVLLAEKDDQIAAKDRTIKLLRALCCVPLYVTTIIEVVQKNYNLVHRKSWLEFVSRSSEPFAESIRQELLNSHQDGRRSAISPKIFCDAILTLFANAGIAIYNFVVKFQPILVVDENEPESSVDRAGILKVENIHLQAFNVLLKAMGLTSVNLTADGELHVFTCNDEYSLARYFNLTNLKRTETLQTGEKNNNV